MKSLLNFEMLLPIGMLILQTFAILLLAISVLKKLKLVRFPFDGLEHSHTIFASAVLFGVILISTADVQAIFQSFKTYQNQPIKIFQPFFTKAGQFLLVILFFELLLMMIIYLLTKAFSSFGKIIKEIEGGNISVSIVVSLVVVGFSLLLRMMATEMMEYITPQFVNFR